MHTVGENFAPPKKLRAKKFHTVPTLGEESFVLGKNLLRKNRANSIFLETGFYYKSTF
jgi:hypothetical protein